MSDIQKVIYAMNNKHFHAQYAKDAAEARDLVLNIISENDKVGVGDSMTLEETGIIDALVSRGNTVHSRALAIRTGADPEKANIEGLHADVYLSSTNAVTLAGDLINIDGVGNRVAGMFYGPHKVVIVAGKNKITSNPHTAIERIKKEACPPNARRLGLDTPCAHTGKCTDCDSPHRMCNVTVRMQYPTRGKHIHVILIDDNFGY